MRCGDGRDGAGATSDIVNPLAAKKPDYAAKAKNGIYLHMAGADEPKRQLHAEAALSPKLLSTMPRLRRAVAYYQKNNIGSSLDTDGTPDSKDDFFESTEHTFYGYEVGFEMAGGVTVVWDTRFLFVRAADGRIDRRKVMSIETVFNF